MGPFGPNSFISCCFRPKNLQNNRLAHPSRELAHTPPRDILDPPMGRLRLCTVSGAFIPVICHCVLPYFSYLCMFLIVFRLLVSGGFLLVITFLVPGRIYCRFISIVVGFSWNNSSHFQLFCVCLFYLLFLHEPSLHSAEAVFSFKYFLFYFLFSFSLSFFAFLELKSLLSVLCFDK